MIMRGDPKTAMAVLLVLTGIFHLAIAMTGDVGSLKLGLSIFGVIYFLVGIFVFPGKHTAVRVAMVMTALGLGLGGYEYVLHGGPIALPIMFLVDVVVLALGGVWLVKNGPAA